MIRRKQGPDVGSWRYDVGDVEGFVAALGSGFAWSLERGGTVLAGGVVKTLDLAEMFMVTT